MAPTPPQNMLQFFDHKHFEMTVSDHGQVFDVIVTVPDLRSCNVDAWGDWGPMYTCHLVDGQHLRVTYRCRETRRTVSYELQGRMVAVNSPMFASERKQTPLYIEVNDFARGIELRGYMNGDGTVVDTSSRIRQRSVAFADLVFREAEFRARPLDVDAPASTSNGHAAQL